MVKLNKSKSKEFLTVEEFSRTFRVSKNSVYKWVRNGTVKAVRIGRVVSIPTSELEAKKKEMNRKGVK